MVAESEDGLEWRRPNLRLVTYAGSRNNNILDTGLPVNGKNPNNITIVPNPAWDGRSATKYVAITFKGGAKPHGLVPLQSADGLKWRLMTDHPLVPTSDENRLTCDLEKKQLIATIKVYGFCMDMPWSVPEYGREVGLTTSRDGLAWTAPDNPAANLVRPAAEDMFR